MGNNSLTFLLVCTFQLYQFIFSIFIYPMDEIENNFEYPKDENQNDDAPRSSCSIEEEEIRPKVQFNLWTNQTPSKTSQKNVSDRYLPIRKTPTSSKDLYFDNLKW